MKVRLKTRSTLTLERLLLNIAIFAISSFALLEHVSIPIPMFSEVKWPLLYLGGACLLTQLNLIIRSFMKRKYFFVWISLLLLQAALFWSAYQNRNPLFGVTPVRNTARMMVYMLELMMLIVWVCEKNYGQYLIKYLFRYVLLLVVITDVVLFTGIMRFYSGHHEAYLLGSKFTVSYMHMNLLVLWGMQTDEIIHLKQFSRLKLCIAVVFLVAVSVRVECMTGMLGCLLLFICLFVVDSPKTKKWLRKLASPVILNIALGANIVFPFLSEVLLSLPFVKYFVVEVLDRSQTLSGRTNIFNIFTNQIADHWLFGYGLGNQNSAAMELFGYANAQNAILQWILQGGIIVTIALIIFMNQVLVRVNKSGNFAKAMPMIVLIYVYIILGFVETTFSMSFLMWVALLLILIYQKPEEQKGTEVSAELSAFQ